MAKMVASSFRCSRRGMNFIIRSFRNSSSLAEPLKLNWAENAVGTFGHKDFIQHTFCPLKRKAISASRDSGERFLREG